MTSLDASLTTYLDHLTVERGLSANTVSAYRRDLVRYCDHLSAAGCVQVEDITTDHVATFAEYLARTGDDPAPASIARAVVAVRNWHRFLADELHIDNVAASVHPPQQARRLPKALGIDDVQRLLETPDTSTVTGVRDAALLELLYGTGARISEVVALDVDDVSKVIDDPDLGLRLVGKGDKERIVPLGRFARRALASWLVRGRPSLAEKGRSTPALFLNSRGNRLSRQSAWQLIGEYARAAGITAEVSPHTLRHSYATHLLDGGADVRVVQELLGHASVTTTQIYTLVSVDHLREVYLTAHPRSR